MAKKKASVEKAAAKKAAAKGRRESNKKYVIERLFLERWDEQTQSLRTPMVTLEEVQAAIREHNAGQTEKRKKLSTRNPANFLKDFIRKGKSANANWPESVFARGYTARQVTGGGNSFAFQKVPEGQTVPFPIIEPKPDAPVRQIESVSLPITSRRLGRKDEPWLVQVLVRQRVLETHFAIFSRNKVVQLDHLQMAVKLSKTEIDALFLALVDAGESPAADGNRRGTEHGAQFEEVIVTCEAKGRADDILVEQVKNQLRSVFGLSGVTQKKAVAVAVKAIGPSRVHVCESQIISADATEAIETLEFVSEAIYEFVTHVPGIGA